MKRMLILAAIIGLFIGSANAQLYGIFKPIGKIILFADSLKAKNTIDWQIDQIKNNRNTKRVKQLDDYNLAVCYIAKNDTDSTCFYLARQIIHFSFFNRLILSDSDFGRLHASPCWKVISDKIDSVFLTTIPTIKEQKLALELFHIYVKDQHIRGYGLKYIEKELTNVDSLNILRVEEIIKEYGWPTYSLVGKEAANGAFMVIQHSNYAIQKKYLNQIVDAAKNKEASAGSVALIQDRILTKEPPYNQIYGTQVFKTQDNTGKWSKYTYYPIKDEENVDARRKEMGLGPLKDYLKRFDIDYVPGTKVQPPPKLQKDYLHKQL